MTTFPDVQAALPGIEAALDERGVVVIEAPPGTGKTTRIPIFLSGHESGGRRHVGQVWVLEPRRVAARASAAFVARSIGESVGATIGYAVRFERRESASTRVMYVTEALFGRRFLADPSLLGQSAPVHTVVLDEFHERSIHTDLALARIRALRARPAEHGGRPDLRLVIMSATLDAAGLARALDAPVIRVEARRFPVELRPFLRKDDRPLVEQVRAGVGAGLASLERLSPALNTVLVFLPGLGEIERCAEALGPDLARLGERVEIVPLHGELDSGSQDRALGASACRRVILATNVAETSVTVEGVGVVVDSGLARVAGHDPWSGLPTLTVQPISRASADQRSGRAGRLGTGVCWRLYSDYDQRPAALAPELQRSELSGVALEVGSEELPWLQPPPVAAWRAARALLVRLGALTAGSHGDRTAVGEAMLGLPLAPRLARVLIEGAALGAGEESATLVALLGRSRGGRAEDPVARVLDGGRWAGEVEQERRQLVALLPRCAPTWAPGARAPERGPGLAATLVMALLAGFPDRVGERRGGRVVFAEGGSAVVDPATPGGDGFVVVPEAMSGEGGVRVRLLTRVPQDWLADRAEVRTTVRWAGTRVEVKEQLLFGDLVLDEGVATPAAGSSEEAEVTTMLATEVAPVAHRVFPDHAAADALVGRIAWLRRVGVDVPEVDLPTVIRQACTGSRSFADLGTVSLIALIGRTVDLSRVDALAPAAIPLGNRKRTPITYPTDQDPFIASRMQDFFGMSRSPLIAGDRPLVLHLLAPNQRPVQITGDLAGFWKNHWPGIRKELQRRYPRQPWPDNPLEAEPPEFRERRPRNI